MKKLPISIIWKSVQIRFTNWWNLKINNIHSIKENVIFDKKWNKYHLNLDEVWSIFEPKSKKYNFKDFKWF